MTQTPTRVAVALCLLLTITILPFAGDLASAGLGPPPKPQVRHPHRVRAAATISPTGLTPAQVRHAYGFDQLTTTGTGQIIGIVNAFDNATVAADLQTFITTLGLAPMYGLPNTGTCTVSAGPHPCFQVVYAQGVQPVNDDGWGLEMALDVEWAHVIAPGADVLLVESNSNYFDAMAFAVDVAVNNGARVVSMSWGADEFTGQDFYDQYFLRPGVTYTSASGDYGNPGIYPSTAPSVISVGGTTLDVDANGVRVGAEIAWYGSGGGISMIEPEPAYQTSYPIPPTGGKRGIPDVAYDADPNTGFPVYDSHYFGQSGWLQVGGTSAGSPQWAGLFALVNQLRVANGLGTLSSSDLANSPVYTAAAGGYAARYLDIVSGSNGNCGTVCTASAGWDFVTGLGSPRAEGLIPSLAGLPPQPTATPLPPAPTRTPTPTSTPTPRGNKPDPVSHPSTKTPRH